jgi:predicted nucleotidyltransferase
MNDLEELLGRKVDLVEEGELLPFAVESANHDKKLIYERAR